MREILAVLFRSSRGRLAGLRGARWRRSLLNQQASRSVAVCSSRTASALEGPASGTRATGIFRRRRFHTLQASVHSSNDHLRNTRASATQRSGTIGQSRGSFRQPPTALAVRQSNARDSCRSPPPLRRCPRLNMFQRCHRLVRSTLGRVCAGHHAARRVAPRGRATGRNTRRSNPLGSCATRRTNSGSGNPNANSTSGRPANALRAILAQPAFSG